MSMAGCPTLRVPVCDTSGLNDLSSPHTLYLFIVYLLRVSQRSQALSVLYSQGSLLSPVHLHSLIILLSSLFSLSSLLALPVFCSLECMSCRVGALAGCVHKCRATPVQDGDQRQTVRQELTLPSDLPGHISGTTEKRQPTKSHDAWLTKCCRCIREPVRRSGGMLE